MALAASLGLGLLATPTFAQVVVAGPSSAFGSSSGSWMWDGGSHLAPFRAALENPALFGPGGTVSEGAVTITLTHINATTLSGVDVFVAPWWADAETPLDAASAIADYFLGGGSVLVYQDDPEHDFIGEYLGVPTLQVESDGTPSNGPPPIFDGVFGQAHDLVGFGNRGQLSFPHVNALDGTVLSTNASGEVTAALWLPGQYAPGAGTLLLVADVDLTASTVASYAPLNDNGIFSLNAIHLLAFEEAGQALPYGCGLNPANSMSILDGAPGLGQRLTLGVDNPLGTQGAGSLTYVFLSTAPSPLFPCGTPLPGFGMGFPGQSAELLIDLAPPNPFAVLLGDPWAGSGSPAAVPLTIPYNPALLQFEMFGQGVIIDPSATFGITAALTDAIHITVGLAP